MENRVFSELDELFGKIAVKIELIAKLSSDLPCRQAKNNDLIANFAKNGVI